MAVSSEMPTISTVYLENQELRHARCRQAAEYIGRRQEVELIFYCRSCHERVSLPEYVLGRIPTAS